MDKKAILEIFSCFLNALIWTYRPNIANAYKQSLNECHKKQLIVSANTCSWFLLLCDCHDNIHMTDSNQTALRSVFSVFASYAGALSHTTTMQHKAHQPLMPCASKYLQYRWDKGAYDIHKKKVRHSAVNGIKWFWFSSEDDVWELSSGNQKPLHY